MSAIVTPSQQAEQQRELQHADIGISLRHLDWAISNRSTTAAHAHLTAARVQLQAASTLTEPPDQDE